jgi:flavin reductase (DIM6/NTAB) family NADH-FMN oxidoreductase RutF
MPTFSRGQHYAINVLASDQQHIAERFARKDIDRFEGVSLRWGQRGVPVIDGAMAVFECFNRSQYIEGDHTIFVGEVEHCDHRDDAQPLIYHGGRFFTELPL